MSRLFRIDPAIMNVKVIEVRPLKTAIGPPGVIQPWRHEKFRNKKGFAE